MEWRGELQAWHISKSSTPCIVFLGALAREQRGPKSPWQIVLGLKKEGISDIRYNMDRP